MRVDKRGVERTEEDVRHWRAGRGRKRTCKEVEEAVGLEGRKQVVRGR